LAVRRANRVKKRLNIVGFDELNVVNAVDALYKELDLDNRREFLRLFLDRYREINDTIYEMAEMYITTLLNEPNETTNYVYASEVLRKRDRAKEAIMSAPTKVQKQILLDKAIRMFEQMTAWYADFVSQGAEIQALKDSGVKKVQRHEMNDDKVCAVCRKADGEIYDIDKIPPLPHPRCRRWFTKA